MLLAHLKVQSYIFLCSHPRGDDGWFAWFRDALCNPEHFAPSIDVQTACEGDVSVLAFLMESVVTGMFLWVTRQKIIGWKATQALAQPPVRLRAQHVAS